MLSFTFGWTEAAAEVRLENGRTKDELFWYAKSIKDETKVQNQFMFQRFWFLIFLIILVLDFWGFCWGVVAYDEGAKLVREGYLIKLEVSQLKSKFGEKAQALIPGDLHTHSVIVYRTCSVFVGVTWFVDVTGHAPTMLMLIFDAGNLYGHFQAARYVVLLGFWQKIDSCYGNSIVFQIHPRV
ncbi:hypothetical protein Drorol1_Dr00018346 [Drosera rotundifolia]